MAGTLEFTTYRHGCHQGGGLHYNDHNLVIPASKRVQIGAGESPERALQDAGIR